MLLALAALSSASNPVKYSLCDVRVLYVYDDARFIEWPVIYYLNDEFGCRVDLVTARERARPNKTTLELDHKQLNSHHLFLPKGDSAAAALLVGELFRDRLPDLVIFGDGGNDPVLNTIKDGIVGHAETEPRLFNISKIYRRYDDNRDRSSSKGFVVLNGRELFKRYRDRMALEIPEMFPGFEIDNYRSRRIIRFRIIKDNIGTGQTEDNFLTGINSLRLTTLIDSLIPGGPMKITLRRQAKKFVSYFNASHISVGQRKVGSPRAGDRRHARVPGVFETSAGKGRARRTGRGRYCLGGRDYSA
jgi:hypothetical protein